MMIILRESSQKLSEKSIHTYKEEYRYGYHSRRNKYPFSHDSTLIHNLLSLPPFLLALEKHLNSIFVPTLKSKLSAESNLNRASFVLPLWFPHMLDKLLLVQSFYWIILFYFRSLDLNKDCTNFFPCWHIIQLMKNDLCIQKTDSEQQRLLV